MKTFSIYNSILDIYPQLLVFLECYQFMTYYTVREYVLACITCNEKMHFQVVINVVTAIYQSKGNEYNATSKIQ